MKPDAEVAIVGAGPIGIELAGAFKREGVPYLHFEAEQIGHTISRYARFTRFFSSPERLAIAGIPIQTPDQEQTTGEVYLSYLRSVVEILDLDIQTFERVIEVMPLQSDDDREGYLVRTQTRTAEHEYLVRKVVFANGDMAHATALGIPGEDLPHVSHFFLDPHLYFRKKLLVVGGRNSAMEAALRSFRAGAKVALSTRGDLDPKHLNSRLHLEMSILTRKGYVEYLPNTVPVEIRAESVLLKTTESHDSDGPHTFEQPADFVLLNTGYTADTSLLRSLGVEFDNEGIPSSNPETLETNVRGIYVAGTAVGGEQHRYHIFIGTAHIHTARIFRAITGSDTTWYGTIPSRRYPFFLSDIQPEGQ